MKHWPRLESKTQGEPTARASDTVQVRYKGQSTLVTISSTGFEVRPRPDLVKAARPVSIENTITYPKGISEGDVLTAIAEEETATNRLGFYRVTVRRADDEVVALFRGTVYKTNQQFFPDTE